MTSLVQRLRNARKVEIKIGAITFAGERATPEDLSMCLNISDAELCRRKITGWSGVIESDIVPTGSKDPVDFNKELFDEIIGEKIEWFKTISESLLKDAASRYKEKQVNEKK